MTGRGSRSPASRCHHVPVSPDPRVSVVVPAYNAQATIGRALDSILAQDYPGPIEIVVADGSTGGATRAVLARYGDRVTVIDNPSGNTPDALNAAITASAGEVIVRCDAQAVLPSDYVRRAVATLISTGAVNVGGVQAAVGETTWERGVATAQSTPLGVGDARYRLGGDPGPVDTVYLGVFRRDALEDAGGFDPRFKRNQDYELNWRLRERGGVVWFDPGLEVEYRPRSTVASLARQYYEYGQWKRRMLAVHPKSVRPRQVAAPLLVLGLLGSMAVATVRPGLGAVLPSVYTVSVVATAVVEAGRRHDPAALLASVAMPIMHLSWGTGFLLGQGTRRS